jgi:hypothetical protein
VRRGGETLLNVRRRVIFPAQAQIQGEVFRHLPVVFNESVTLVDDDGAVNIRLGHDALPFGVLDVLE